MKIVCGACGAKYSIADEKVQGKVFKIRCKKCSNVIVVKGEDDEAAGGQGAAEWYVVIDGDQVGPITSVEVDSYYMSGRINADTFAWRDGLADWSPISGLSEFAHLNTDTAGPDEATQISDGFAQMSGSDSGDQDATISMTSSADTFGDAAYAASEPEPSFAEAAGGLGGGESGYSAGEFDGGFSDFGGGAAAPAGGGFAAFDSPDSGGGGFDAFDGGGSGFGGGELTSSSGGTGGGGGGESNAGMFASFDSSGGNDDFLGFSSGGSAAVETAPAPTNGSNGASANGSGGSNGSANNMVGQRNENSVLFSLSSLDQVQAVGSPSPSGGGGLDLSGGTGGDAATTEGSGLIDIRALATAHSQMKDAGGSAADNLDPFSAGTMAMPALMPMGSHRSNKPLIIGGIIGAIVVIGLLATVVVVLLNKEDKPDQPQIVEKIVERVIVEKGPSDSEQAKQQSEAEKAAQLALKKAEDGEKAEPDDKKEDSSSKKSSSSSKRSSKKSDPEPAAKEEPKKSTKKKGGDGIDDLLAKIDEGGDKKKSSAPAPKKKTTPTSSGGKSSLTKSDVSGTIGRYRGRVNTCYKSQNKNNLSGTMMVGFAIKPDGGVTNVSIKTGKFAGTDVGKCVEKAVKGMKFPSTSAKSNVNVTKYPFKLQ